MLAIVAYDIGDDRRRGEVSALLAACGARVQLSVFECDLPGEAALTQLAGRLKDLIDEDDDQIRIYALPGEQRSAQVIGSRTLEERRDFWIL